MKKTRNKLTIYWDNVISKKIPEYVGLEKIESEFKEHFAFLKWAFKRIILPLAAFYLLAGIFSGINLLGSLLLGMAVFLYSNFLPDTDFLIKVATKKESGKYEKYLLLFFAPFYIYYILDGKVKPLYTTRAKCFHNVRTLLIYGTFLFVLGFMLWTDSLKAGMLSFFGMLGFTFHLMVDGRVKNIFHKSFQKSILKKKEVAVS